MLCLKSSVADPIPGSEIRWLAPGTGIQIGDLGWNIQNQDPGSRIRDPGAGMNIPDLIYEDLVLVFWVKNTKIL
jgi:hypothetical protein